MVAAAAAAASGGGEGGGRERQTMGNAIGLRYCAKDFHTFSLVNVLMGSLSGYRLFKWSCSNPTNYCKCVMFGGLLIDFFWKKGCGALPGLVRKKKKSPPLPRKHLITVMLLLALIVQVCAGEPGWWESGGSGGGGGGAHVKKAVLRAVAELCVL